MIRTDLSNAAAHSVQKKTLVSQITRILIDKIADRALLPGEKIDVKGLCREFDISATPVREALQKLVQDGILESRPFVGYFVTELSLTDVSQLFSLREAIETFALRSAIERIDRDEWLALRSENSRLLQDIHAEGFGEEAQRTFQNLDHKLHMELIIRGSGNKWLITLSNGLMDLISLSRHLTRSPQAAIREHELILDALLDRDIDMAVRGLNLHLARSKEEAEASYSGPSS